jgi:hypothetical protein
LFFLIGTCDFIDFDFIKLALGWSSMAKGDCRKHQHHYFKELHIFFDLVVFQVKIKDVQEHVPYTLMEGYAVI